MELRRAARIIVINSSGCVLLFKHRRSVGEPFWAPPGGGVEEGETFEQAAAREASEEMGLVNIELTPLWQSVADLYLYGRPIHQDEAFFLLQVHDLEFTKTILASHQAEGILDTRWWTVTEIQQTVEPVFPRGLIERLRATGLIPSR